MNKNILILNELSEKTGVSENDVRDWERFGLLTPSGFTSDRVPFFGEEALEKASQIKTLAELGFGIRDIRKIVKKVGLPKRGEEAKSHSRKSDTLTVGALAERADVSPRTLKHWEDKGIIEPAMRSEGGFRIYAASSVKLCCLIKDLQLFGYTLEEIKAMADDLRDFQSVRNGLESISSAEASRKLEAMLDDIRIIRERMKLLKEGVKRWESLLKKTGKEIVELRSRAAKRTKKEKRKERP